MFFHAVRQTERKLLILKEPRISPRNVPDDLIPHLLEEHKDIIKQITGVRIPRNTCDLIYNVFKMKLLSFVVYRRIPKVTAPLLSNLAAKRGRYFRVAVTLGRLKNFSNSQWFHKRNMNLKVILFMHVTTHMNKATKLNI